MSKHTLNLLWIDDDGAEPSNIFDSFRGRTFLVRLSVPYDPIRIVWDGIVETLGGDYSIQCRPVEDDGEPGDPMDILLSFVESIEYL
jgi:hypothetical protein